MENKEEKVEETKVVEETKKEGKKTNTTLIVTIAVGGGLLVLVGLFFLFKSVFGFWSNTANNVNSKVNKVKKQAEQIIDKAIDEVKKDIDKEKKSNSNNDNNTKSDESTKSNSSQPTYDTTNGRTVYLQGGYNVTLSDSTKPLLYEDPDISTDLIKAPKINATSEGAASINEKIRKVVNGAKSDSKNSKLDYFTTVQRNTLSIVLYYPGRTNNRTYVIAYKLSLYTGEEQANSTAMVYSTPFQSKEEAKAAVKEVFLAKVNANPDLYNKEITVNGVKTTPKEATLKRLEENDFDWYSMYYDNNDDVIFVNEEYTDQGNQGASFLINLTKKEYTELNR